MRVCSGDRWLTGCILVNTGPQLTWLDLHTDKHSDHLLDQLQQLHNLHELTITDFSSPGKCFANSLGLHVDFSSLTVCLFFLFRVCRAPWYCMLSLRADLDITLPDAAAKTACASGLHADSAGFDGVAFEFRDQNARRPLLGRGGADIFKIPHDAPRAALPDLRAFLWLKWRRHGGNATNAQAGAPALHQVSWSGAVRNYHRAAECRSRSAAARAAHHI